MKSVIWILILLLINEDIITGCEIKECSIQLEDFSNEPSDTIETQPKESLVDILIHKLGFIVQKHESQETECEKKTRDKLLQTHPRIFENSPEEEESNNIEFVTPLTKFKIVDLGEFVDKRAIAHNENNLPNSNDDNDKIENNSKWIPILIVKDTENLEKAKRYLKDFYEGSRNIENYLNADNDKWVPQVKYLDKMNNYLKDDDEEDQLDFFISDKSIAQMNGLREGSYARKKDESNCANGKYIRRDCNVCYCMDGKWNCTTANCDNTKPIKLRGEAERFFKKLQEAATNCLPGDIIHDDENKNCPCTCILPSILSCGLCPALKEMKDTVPKNSEKGR